MKIDITNFWSANNDDKPVLTQAMVAFAEKSLNVKLPQMLIDLLMNQNGGYTNGFSFPMAQQTSWSSNHIPLFELFGIITEKSIEDWKKTWDEKRLIDLYVVKTKCTFC